MVWGQLGTRCEDLFEGEKITMKMYKFGKSVIVRCVCVCSFVLTGYLDLVIHQVNK